MRWQAAAACAWRVKDAAFVGLGAASLLQQHIALHARRLGRHLRYRVRVGSFEAICGLVEQGIGLGVVPQTAARRCARTMQLRRAVLDEPWAARTLLACTWADAPLPAHARRLLDELARTPA